MQDLLEEGEIHLESIITVNAVYNDKCEQIRVD
jgi:hypothetical protein